MRTKKKDVDNNDIMHDKKEYFSFNIKCEQMNRIRNLIFFHMQDYFETKS